MSKKMQKFKSKELLSIVLDSQSEKKLIKSFQKAFPGMWEDSSCWATLGDSDNLAAATSAQQKTPEAAAKELVANGLDAVLLPALAALPMGVASPKTNKEVWTLLESFGVTPAPGALVVFRQADAKAEGAEEDEGPIEVAFGVMDRGCGQPPHKMRTTFLAVLQGAANKLGLPYMMGRYCAGSTGVHNFAGSEGIKVVITRTADADCPWSCALVRYRPKSRGVLEFFAPNGEIPTMPGVPLVPLRDGAGNSWAGCKGHKSLGVLESGTFVKVYSFDMPRLGNSSFAALAAMVDQRFGTLPFPVACFDSTRGGHYTLNAEGRSGADLRWAQGVCSWADKESAKLACDHFVEFQVTDESWEGAVVTVKVRRLPESSGLHKQLGAPRVFHLLSQQVHCVETKAWLADLELSALADEIVVDVDASGLPEHLLGRIFSADREHINDNPIGRGYRQVVGQAIKSEEVVLRWAAEARERRKRAALDSSMGDYADKFERWGQAARSAATKAAKKKLESMRAEARLVVEGDTPASGAHAGVGVGKKGAAAALPASAGRVPGKSGGGSKSTAKTRGTRDAGAATRVPGLAKKTKKISTAKIVRARKMGGEGGVDKELAPELFVIQAAKVAGEDTVLTFFLKSPEGFEAVAGSEIVFDLEVEGLNGKTIKVNGVSTVWVSAAELDGVDGLELDAPGRRGAAQLMLVCIGTEDGRSHEGKPTKKMSETHRFALYEARALDSMIEVSINIDHPRLVEEAAGGSLQEFQDEMVSTVYSFIVGSMGAKARVSAISPLFVDGRKLASTEAQLEALIPALDAMAVALESMVSVALLRQAEKEGRKGARRSK